MALALAGIFERVGELPLAWVAYQRGLELKEKFWPDPEVKNLFGLAYQNEHRNPDIPDFETRAPLDSDYVKVNQDIDWGRNLLGFGLLGAGLCKRFVGIF